MGLLDKSRLRAERSVTDAVIGAVATSASSLHPRGLMAMCPEGHAHYSVSTEWGDAAAIFVRCHPTTFQQIVPMQVADDLHRHQHAGASMAYLEAHARGGLSTPFAPAALSPDAVAALIAERAPRTPPASAAPPPTTPPPRPHSSVPPAPPGFPTAPPVGPPAPMAVNGALLAEADALVALLREYLPDMQIDLRVTPGAKQCLVGFGLLEELNVEAEPRPDSWTLTVRGFGGSGPITRQRTFPRDIPRDSLATELIETLTIAGSVFVRGSASGGYVNLKWPRGDGLFWPKRGSARTRPGVRSGRVVRR